MAYPYRVNEGDIWSGLMSKRKIPRTWRNPGGFQREDWGHWRTTPRTLPNTGPPGWKPKAAGVATKKKGPTAEERAEAWKLAMEDAQGFMGPMQGDTIPGVAPGGGSQDHKMSVYGTGGYDLASNRPIADTDAVRKRLYGIMGFV